jgi:membrane fusion protein (multidrug efflux system)
MRRTICALLLSFGFASVALAQQNQPTTIPVGTVKAERKAFGKNFEFVGRVEAIERVDIRARVTGYLEAVLFREGDSVKEGSPLYRIEKGQFEAAVKQAQGALERSEAEQKLAVVQLQRAEELVARNAGTVVARDQALAAEETAKGNILSNEANLQNAQLNLSYTDITAPISGKISKTNVTKGNVVGPDSGVLTTIVSQDPMYVTFPVSQREFLRAQKAGRDIDIDVSVFEVKLRFADGTLYNQTGRINFVDVTVNRATDTIMARATVPNPKGVLVDGQFVRVSVEIGTPEEKVMIPQAALLADQEGVYVFVVQDGKAVVRRVKPSAEVGADVVIDEGLSGGEQVVVQGLQALSPGMSVRATPLTDTLSRS